MLQLQRKTILKTVMVVAAMAVAVLAPLDVQVHVQVVAVVDARVVVIVVVVVLAVDHRKGTGINVKNTTSWQSGRTKNITFIVAKDCQLACKLLENGGTRKSESE